MPPSRDESMGQETPPAATESVDVVIVSYNSRDELRGCVEGLSRDPEVAVVVVDNASTDDSLGVVADLPVEAIRQSRNTGFAHGCNVGWRAGRAPFVLFLNPDARIDADAVARLRTVLEDDPAAGACAPLTRNEDGSLQYCQRRFPGPGSAFARALFLHRLFPGAPWTDEVISAPEAYARRTTPEWVSGACVMVRRTALERLDGFDERFFMYSEDTDLCRRLWDEGSSVVYEPTATATHVGGASAPRASLLPVLAASRLLYARKHRGRGTVLLERIGIALEELIRLIVAPGGRSVRSGHARALLVALGRGG